MRKCAVLVRLPQAANNIHGRFMRGSSRSDALQKGRVVAVVSGDEVGVLRCPTAVRREDTLRLPPTPSNGTHPVVPTMRIWTYLFIAIALCAVLRGQKPPSEAEGDPLFAFQRQSALELVNHYFDLPTIPLFITRRLINLGDPRAIPGLRGAFDRESKPLNREFIAAALVRLGDKNPRYFNYLTGAVLDALNEDVPYRSTRASDAAVDELELHVEIQTWAQVHSTPVTQAIWQATIEVPGAIEALGLTGDRRSMLILLRALKSPNILVVRQAAFALARMQRKSAIGPITTACQLQRMEDRLWTAKSLLYFRSEKAQEAARELIADPVKRQQWRIDVQREERHAPDWSIYQSHYNGSTAPPLS